jgi:hypothetical protein
VRSVIDALGEDTVGGAGYGGDVRLVEIDGVEYVYTGTDHRWLLYKAYARSLAEAGSFGFGTGFSHKNFLEDRLSVFRSIDNYYVELQLGNGLVGLWMFIIIQGVAILCLLKPAWEQRDPIMGALSGTMLASLAGVGVMHLTVSMLGDEKTLWSFCLGSAITIGQLARATPLPVRRPMRPVSPIPVLR